MKPSKNNPSKVVLLDIDYTLFNVEIYRKKIFTQIINALRNTKVNSNLLEKVYFESRKNSFFVPSKFIKELIKTLGLDISPRSLLHLLWDKKGFSESLYDEVKRTLKILSNDKDLKIGIFSQGHNSFQKRKIKEIEGYLHKECVHVYAQKNLKFKTIYKKYKESKIFYVDDILDFLREAKNTNKNITTIWIKRGRFAERQTISDFTPDKIIYKLDELVEIIKKS